ncbi:MAG TPA: EAL domain-containing protein, partial [Mycobacterium sp.]
GGTVFPIDLHVTEVSDAGPRVFTGAIRDITERRRAESALRYHALHDPLTGLANRVLFRDHLDGALARRARQPGTAAVLFLDLDRFKVVNDDLGHAAGDRLLAQAGDRLRTAVRPADTIARLGGDEFAILLESVDTHADVGSVARRVLDLISDPFPLDTKQVTVTTSIGIAATDGHQSADELLSQADAALYRAKGSGRNRYEIFDEPLRRWLHGRLNSEIELRKALTLDQIEVHYQPLQALNVGRGIDSVEALARWRHPQRGLLPAAEFIELAEETGVIAALDATVLAMVGRQLQTWGGQFDAPDVAVNLSPRTLASDSLISALTASGIHHPDRLWVEITESVLMTDMAGVAARLDQLRGLGVRIAIDDFGTGHSSLTYLKRLPIDAIKIDKTFVDRLGRDPDDTAIVTAVVTLGHTIGVRVVAEGVETERQRDILTELGCDYAQGHLISRAIPAAGITSLLGPASRA